MKALAFVFGVIAGGLFFNAKFTEASPTVKVPQEVIYGTKVGPDGQVILVKHR